MAWSLSTCHTTSWINQWYSFACSWLDLLYELFWGRMNAFCQKSASTPHKTCGERKVLRHATSIRLVWSLQVQRIVHVKTLKHFFYLETCIFYSFLQANCLLRQALNKRKKHNLSSERKFKASKASMSSWLFNRLNNCCSI